MGHQITHRDRLIVGRNRPGARLDPAGAVRRLIVVGEQSAWERMDGYFAGKLLGADEALVAAAAASDAASLPPIAVSPLQGRFLELLAISIRARNVLEIGTLGGYSTICLARGVGPGGRVLSLEYQPRHAEVARSSIAAVRGRGDPRRPSP